MAMNEGKRFVSTRTRMLEATIGRTVGLAMAIKRNFNNAVRRLAALVSVSSQLSRHLSQQGRDSQLVCRHGFAGRHLGGYVEGNHIRKTSSPIQ